MNNVLIEQIITRQVPKIAIFVKAGMIALCFLSAFIMVNFGSYGFVSLVVAIFLTVLVFQNYNMEFEYEYLNGELTIDKIIDKRNRRNAGVFDFNKLEVMTSAESSIWEEHMGKGYKRYDFSSGDPLTIKYTALLMSKDERVLLTFEPNVEIYDAIRDLAKGKVI